MASLPRFTLVRATLAYILCASLDTHGKGATTPDPLPAGCSPIVPLREQDQALNQYYRELMDRLRDPSRAQLRHAQRAWLKDRDLRCDLDPMARHRER
ncbi:MAG: lysozyme inhibitor LprI family protein [Gammaproteobacteria bacterium]